MNKKEQTSKAESGANGNVIVFPEFAELRDEVEKLRTELSILFLELDELQYVECKNIEMKYVLALGAMEYKVYELECELLRLKRKVELIQAKKNRQEKILTSDIDKLLDDEFAKYKEELKKKMERVNSAFDRSKARLCTQDETKEIKKLYRTIVKSLHPDINKNLSKAQIKLFHNAVSAYENGDLNSLRIIEQMLSKPEDIDVKENGLAILVKEKERLLILLDSVRTQIVEIKENYPYTLKPIIQNKALINARKEELESDISSFKEMIDHYEKRIKDMLG